MNPFFTKVVSGGQTGVDRAALDVALERGIPCGGWCPRGRRAEDGPIDARYPLQEVPPQAAAEIENGSSNAQCGALHPTPWDGYPQRTRWNVRDSDGTLILTLGEPTGGTALTIDYAQRLGKPYLVLDLAGEPDAATVRAWAEANGVRVLNVAGPRASENPGIHERAARFLRALLV